MKPTVAALMGALAALGCSGASSSGPTVANVAGTWSYTADNLAAGNGVTCDIVNVTMVLDQNGSTFTGTYANAELQCLVNGVEQDQGPYNGNVVNGVVNGDQVTFDFDTPAWTNSGAISGSSMSGPASVNVAVGETTYTLTGTWDATF